jgi:predicted nucleic acid-binding protein
MSGWVVCDSGILLKSVLPEPDTKKAETLLENWKVATVRIAAPTLFKYEIVSVMRLSVYKGILSIEEAVRRRNYLLEYPVETIIDEALLKRGYELATLYNRPRAYDAQYLAVAERLSCEFWTADEKLFNAVNRSLNWVKWIGNFP